MARAASFTDEEIVKARLLREQATTARDLRKALSVLLVAEAGLSTDKASDVLGISRRSAFRNRGSIRHQGERGKNSWGGRRHYRMTLDEEREFLGHWEARGCHGITIAM